MYISTFKFFDVDVFPAMFLWDWFHHFNLVAYKLCQIESSSFVEFISLGLNLLLHQFLWKTSACRQHKNFVWLFLLHQSQIHFHYLMRFVSKDNCCNMEIKYHQIDAHKFHNLWLDSWYLCSPTTRILVSSFDPWAPVFGGT